MKKRFVSFLLAVMTLLSLLPSALAISWDGSSTDGGGHGSSATVNGYAIRTTGDNCIGYRFSVVDKTGANKVTKVIDVFRDMTYGNYEYTNGYKFTVKYNKKQFIDNQSSGFSTSKNTTNCYKETGIEFATALPTPDGMGKWQNNTTNLNKVLSKLGVGSIDKLKNGDKVLVEPIYDVALEGHYHAVTVTELGMYGKYLLGSSSDGGSSSVSDSWGFISNYTNKHYPNALYTPDGQGLWTGVSGTSSRLTFKKIITQGWGVGIAYTETKSDFSPALSVLKCEVYPGTKGNRTDNKLHGTSTGSTFSKYTYANGYPKADSTVWYSVNFPAEEENCRVKQTVTVVDGGTTSRKVNSNSNTWYDVGLSPTTVPNDVSHLTVKAKVDWIDSSGKVLKYGTEKTFYIPIRPTVYRDQVTAYDYEGKEAAHNGSAGSFGTLYLGQKVYVKYKYSGANEWASSNNLYGIMHEWKNGAWVSVMGDGKQDLVSEKATLSASTSKNLKSSLGYVRVPDNSGSGSSVMRFKLQTKWASDTAHTSQYKYINLPVSKADVELSELYLVDDAGYIADTENLAVGEHITVYYTYKNNTDCKVFVEGFNDDGSQLEGVYTIPANGEITVKGESFTVSNKRSFSLWGGVYLEGAGKGNTSWESNGTNNEKTLNCKSKHPITIVPITPNAPYRESTSVISSFRVYNSSALNFTPAENLKVRFTASKGNGSVIYTATKTVVVPANRNNLVYFKWQVPTGLNGGSVIVKAEIVENGVSYNPVSRNRATVPFYYYTTPNTQYESKAPAGFAVPPAPTAVQNHATWSEYVYENGSFTEKTYGIGIAADSEVPLTPADGNSAALSGGTWKMKSGYGVWLEDGNSLLSFENYLFPGSSAYTPAQYAYALYPEYGYEYGADKCTTLYLDSQSSTWQLSRPGASKLYHYTPLYFPDGKYIVQVVKSDMWTPAGMVLSVDTTRPITVSGNAYDDWYIGHK